jgi:hypothetical protein
MRRNVSSSSLTMIGESPICTDLTRQQFASRATRTTSKEPIPLFCPQSLPRSQPCQKGTYLIQNYSPVIFKSTWVTVGPKNQIYLLLILYLSTRSLNRASSTATVRGLRGFVVLKLTGQPPRWIAMLSGEAQGARVACLAGPCICMGNLRSGEVPLDLLSLVPDLP